MEEKEQSIYCLKIEHERDFWYEVTRKFPEATFNVCLLKEIYMNYYEILLFIEFPSDMEEDDIKKQTKKITSYLISRTDTPDLKAFPEDSSYQIIFLRVYKPNTESNSFILTTECSCEIPGFTNLIGKNGVKEFHCIGPKNHLEMIIEILESKDIKIIFKSERGFNSHERIYDQIPSFYENEELVKRFPELAGIMNLLSGSDSIEAREDIVEAVIQNPQEGDKFFDNIKEKMGTMKEKIMSGIDTLLKIVWISKAILPPQQ